MKKRKCPYMWAFTQAGDLVAVVCGQWDCPHCSKVNANKWAQRVIIHLELRQETAYFWTLTMRAKYKKKEDAYEQLPKLWNTLRMRIQRFYMAVWEYCAFVEGQRRRKDMPHFHIISMRKAPARLKDLAMEVGFGFEAKEEIVTSIRASLYVSKYSSKGDGAMPKNFRRVRASQTWAKLPKKRRQPLIVQAKDEQIQHYLVRVADITGKDLDSLYNVWSSRVEN